MIPATTLTDGTAQGTLVLLSEPLSLWGGLDVHTGAIIDAQHPQCGVTLAGRILAMKSARGSSSSSSALVEAARSGVAPAAIILLQHDAILVIGALVAADLYQVKIPIVTLAQEQWEHLQDGSVVTVNAQTASPEFRLHPAELRIIHPPAARSSDHRSPT